MALQSTASTSDPIKLSEVKTEFSYWVTSNNLRDFMYKGIGPANGVYVNTTPPNDALNLTSFLGKEGGGDTWYYQAGFQVTKYYWELEETFNSNGWGSPFYKLWWNHSNEVQINGDLPNNAADYYDTTVGTAYRYFRGKLEATVNNGPGDTDGDTRTRYYGISRMTI